MSEPDLRPYVVTLAVGEDTQARWDAERAAYFPAGRWSTWTIDQYVRKQAVLRVPVPFTALGNGGLLPRGEFTTAPTRFEDWLRATS